jgi:hypothetical protein
MFIYDNCCGLSTPRRSYSNNPIISKYRDCGFFAVVRKPYVIKELSDALKKLEFLRTTDPDREGWNLSD